MLLTMLQSASIEPIGVGSPLWPAFDAALRAASLPTDDLNEPGQRFYAFRDGAAFGGFALDADVILLRSLVVAPALRRRGLGRQILDALLAEAYGAREAWLLTTTAALFFTKAGFVVTDRAAAPPFVASSRQFSSLCPSSAVLMWRPLA